MPGQNCNKVAHIRTWQTSTRAGALHWAAASPLLSSTRLKRVKFKCVCVCPRRGRGVQHKTLSLQQYKPNSLARLLCAVLDDCCASLSLSVCACVCGVCGCMTSAGLIWKNTSAHTHTDGPCLYPLPHTLHNGEKVQRQTYKIMNFNLPEFSFSFSPETV